MSTPESLKWDAERYPDEQPYRSDTLTDARDRIDCVSHDLSEAVAFLMRHPHDWIAKAWALDVLCRAQRELDRI